MKFTCSICKTDVKFMGAYSEFVINNKGHLQVWHVCHKSRLQIVGLAQFKEETDEIIEAVCLNCILGSFVTNQKDKI